MEVAERIAAPQRSSARTIYKSKWDLFEKWSRENLVDFSTPSVKQVSDLFMYLYQDLNRRLSTIDGYRAAIVDTLGPAGLHTSQSSDLNRLLAFTGIVAVNPDPTNFGFVNCRSIRNKGPLLHDLKYNAVTWISWAWLRLISDQLTLMVSWTLSHQQIRT